MPEMVEVRYTGTRRNLMRVKIWVNGDVFSPRGYVFGWPVDTQRMTRAEAEVLTGLTPPLVVANQIVNGWRIDGRLPPDVAKDEKYVIEE